MEDQVPESEDTSGMTEMQKKLFNIRMKINQGRKANKAEVEDEYRRFNDKNYEQKKYKARKNEQSDNNVDGIEEEREAPPKWNTDKNAYLQQTAESAEQALEKIKKKEENMATFGWQAFTADATNKAYTKKLKKLPTSKGIKESTETALESNPLNYGQTHTTVPSAALDRLSKDITEREEANRKFSKRRLHIDAADVDYINDKNANFNKKLSRAFDKYTVEIRQNLERGTAL